MFNDFKLLLRHERKDNEFFILQQAPVRYTHNGGKKHYPCVFSDK